MKKCFLFLMAFALTLCLCASAEEVSVYGGSALEPEAEVTIDLDGDGTAETLVWHLTYLDEYEYDAEQVISVTGEWGFCEYDVGILGVAHAYVCDMDDDGVQEIFVDGDQMSDDYVTVCLRLSGGKLIPALFADGWRGENGSGYFKVGYGFVAGIGQNRVTLCGTQDMLGTYFGTRDYAWQDGLFEFCDDGMWKFERDLDDEEMWVYGAITPNQDVPAVLIADDGTETEGTLAAGTPIAITATDKQNTVCFVTKDGISGRLTVWPDLNQGWGVTINDIPEAELFPVRPYAD